MTLEQLWLEETTAPKPCRASAWSCSCSWSWRRGPAHQSMGCHFTPSCCHRALQPLLSIVTAPQHIHSEHKCFGSQTKHTANTQIFPSCCSCPFASPRSDQWLSRTLSSTYPCTTLGQLFLRAVPLSHKARGLAFKRTEGRCKICR